MDWTLDRGQHKLDNQWDRQSKENKRKIDWNLGSEENIAINTVYTYVYKLTIQRGEQIIQDMRRITEMFTISWKSLNATENNENKIEKKNEYNKRIQEERIKMKQVLNIEH